jgi:class 3 adenylate cyclase/DNA-binding transcriptional MerR regulator
MPLNQIPDEYIKMISSKEVMSRTGISRATLNNYIGLNLIPSPSVRPPEEPGGPTKIGYFPEWVVERIEKIHQLKGQGMRMSQIAMHFTDVKEEPPEVAAESPPHQWLDQIIFPAILVNHDWQIIGLNNMAEKLLLGENREGLQSPVRHGFLQPSLIKKLIDRFANWREILIPHIRLAKKDMGAELLRPLQGEEDSQLLKELRQLWNEVQLLPYQPFRQQTLSLKNHHGGVEHFTLLSWELSEGTLLLYPPASMQFAQMMDFIAGKTKIPKPVLLRKTPPQTSLCILALRLESELHLQTALPPSLYFNLINQLILGWHRCFKEHSATPGRFLQEGAVGFFLEESERKNDHLFQSLLCAQALQSMTRRVDREWRRKQAWNNSLRVNIAIHCGRDWLGMVPSPLAFEFTVVGNTLVEAVKLSDFSQRGTIWASKEVIENLSPSDRERVEFGIRLEPHGEGFVSPGLYSPVGELLSQDDLERKRLQNIKDLAVTEILDVIS